MSIREGCSLHQELWFRMQEPRMRLVYSLHMMIPQDQPLHMTPRPHHNVFMMFSNARRASAQLVRVLASSCKQYSMVFSLVSQIFILNHSYLCVGQIPRTVTKDAHQRLVCHSHMTTCIYKLFPVPVRKNMSSPTMRK
jgi:hypothetical protein